MILTDRATLTMTERLDSTDTAEPRFVDYGDIPVEINPIESEIYASSQLIITRYRFVTTAHLIDILMAQRDVWKADDDHTDRGSRGVEMKILYNGNQLTFSGGFEIHRLMGRFNHIEAVLEEFGIATNIYY